MTTRQSNKLADRFPQLFLGREWPWRNYFGSVVQSDRYVTVWRVSVDEAWAAAKVGDEIIIGTRNGGKFGKFCVAIFWP